MNIWQTILQLLKSRHSLYLLTVIESSGSAPGRRGFKMMVADNGELYGSIGGGIMEYNLVEKAKSLLLATSSESFTVKQVHNGSSESSSGMICSGTQIVAFTPLFDQHKEIIAQCDSRCQMIKISSTGLDLLDVNQAEMTEILSDDVWFYTELLNSQLIVHIFGAGHVSLPTSELLSKLGFQVNLYDNRYDINTFMVNNYASYKKIINYEAIFTSINVTQNDYVLLMTHKFTEDKLLLSQLLKSRQKYLGVLGSKNKINVMFSALVNDGYAQTDLNKVYAPVGVNINSRTVQEIAVSIAAEIINIKNKS
ncbi:MAG: XdhC family protein [Alcanivoracaceae bacterium]|nr:XdhC family protein [Alcanivoracaceae bacterium]